MKSMRVAATFMRGGTSKGVFFSYDALPKSMQKDKALRDRFLLRIMGSPDPYGQQIDGMGGATPSTSKVVLVQPSRRPGFDVEYLFGAVSIAEQKIDWSGNCGNLTAAVAPFAVHAGLLFPADGLARVDMWQANIGQHIVARLRIEDGEAVEHGDFELDGVAFPGAEIQLDFLESESPAGDDATSMFPTGRQSQTFAVPGFGNVQATLISSGAPTVFVRAADFGLPGHASKSEIEGNDAARHGLQAVRRLAAVAMGLSSEPESADVQSPHAPRVCFVAPPASYLTSAGKAGCVEVHRCPGSHPEPGALASCNDRNRCGGAGGRCCRARHRRLRHAGFGSPRFDPLWTSFGYLGRGCRSRPYGQRTLAGT